MVIEYRTSRCKEGGKRGQVRGVRWERGQDKELLRRWGKRTGKGGAVGKRTGQGSFKKVGKGDR